MIVKSASLFLLVFHSLIGFGQQTIEDKELSISIDSLRKAYNVPSVSIALISDGEISWAEGFGAKNAKIKDSVNTNTLYQAASISKTISALGTISLIQSGQIGLNDNVNDHLKSWRIPSSIDDSIITPYNLLSHTSGLYPAHFYGYKAHKATPNLLQILNGEKPCASKAIIREKDVGFEYKYSGSGYCILQQLIEDKTNLSFDLALNELVLSPLNMEHSSFSVPTNLDSLALAHYKGKPLKNGYMIYPELGAAGLWSTPTDLAILLIELGKCNNQNDQLIRTELIKAMITPTNTDDGKINNYGLGLMLDQQANGLHVGHTGSTAGYRCFMKYNIDENYGVVIMTNSANGIPLIDHLVEHIAQYYEWENFNALF